MAELTYFFSITPFRGVILLILTGKFKIRDFGGLILWIFEENAPFSRVSEEIAPSKGAISKKAAKKMKITPSKGVIYKKLATVKTVVYQISARSRIASGYNFHIMYYSSETIEYSPFIHSVQYNVQIILITRLTKSLLMIYVTD